MRLATAQILVVDDEEAIRLTLEILLKRRGYEVTTAASGAEALALIEQHVFDLLLLDLKMPGLSGLDVARRARLLQPEVTILFLTGSTTIAGAPEEPDLEQFDVLIKTASPQEVLEHVAAALEER